MTEQLQPQGRGHPAGSVSDAVAKILAASASFRLALAPALAAARFQELAGYDFDPATVAGALVTDHLSSLPAEEQREFWRVLTDPLSGSEPPTILVQPGTRGTPILQVTVEYWRGCTTMISNDKQKCGLLAINAILVLARSLAYAGKSGDVAVVLDVAEYLPMLMLEPDDRTAEFRDQLVDLARRYPTFVLALDRFDGASQGP